MQTTEYHLYRVKFIKPAQMNLFNANTSPREIFENALSERPSIELRRNNVWHIGNVEPFTASGGRFAVGRTTITTVEKYDEKTGNFTELLDDSGPYTFVYFDSRIGLLGIGKRAKVATDVNSIAKKIQRLLAGTKAVQNNQVSVRVNFIPDPEGFLEKLFDAYAIKQFKAQFTGPNPIDADELFQKPMSYYCQQMGAEQGSVSVSGESLNDEVIAAVAKSTAATGNGASALIQRNKGERPVAISFKGDAKKVMIDNDYRPDHILEVIQVAYQGVRK